MQKQNNQIICSRRKLLTTTMALAASNALSPSFVRAATGDDTCQFSGLISDPLKTKIENMSRLYCLAYITPNAPGQEDQEHLVAKYPMSIVPQDSRKIFVDWRNKVKDINPNQVMLAYQNVLTESHIPGPGHDIMRELSKKGDYWSHYPGGYTPTVFTSRRMYDYRKSGWKEAFINACSSVLDSYPYDGLFLDNCTVFSVAHPFAWKREIMRGALQDTLIALRKKYPNILIVGNSIENWPGLNGEMNEGREKGFNDEFKNFNKHYGPRVDMAHVYLKNNSTSEHKRLENIINSITDNKVFLGASVDPQHIIWPKIFDSYI